MCGLNEGILSAVHISEHHNHYNLLFELKTHLAADNAKRVVLSSCQAGVQFFCGDTDLYRQGTLSHSP